MHPPTSSGGEGGCDTGGARPPTEALVAGWVNNSMGKSTITRPIVATARRYRSPIHGRVQGKECSRLFSLQRQAVGPRFGLQKQSGD